MYRSQFFTQSASVCTHCDRLQGSLHAPDLTTEDTIAILRELSRKPCPLPGVPSEVLMPILQQY